MNPEINYRKAVILTLCSALLYAVMAMLAKLASSECPSTVIVFFRFLVSFSYILIAIPIRIKNNLPLSIRTQNFKVHFFRGLFGFTAIMLIYYSLAYLPLYDASLLATTYPLFIPILVSIFMGIITPKKMWAGIVIGFLGVAFILKPTAGIFHPASLVALGGGFSFAISLLILRQLAKCEDNYTIMFYYFLFTLLFSGVFIIFDWKTPSPHALLLLIGVGLTGTIYQETSTRAIKHAPARIVSTVMYLNIVFSIILSGFVFGQLPHFTDWIGIALVCFGAIYTVFHASRSDIMKRRVSPC